MVAAHDDEAVRRLRELKHREEKPFALMFPSLEAIKAPLRSLAAGRAPPPLPRSPSSSSAACRATHAHGRHRLAPSLAPGNPNLGVMLPYTPLHHLLLSLLGFPVVATSGNLQRRAHLHRRARSLERLGGIADLFLVHNRPIVRHVDDSIVRVMLGRELVLRRARGYAPLPITVDTLEARGSASVLAVGAHLKNTVALSVGAQVFISQHIGDLETDQAFEAFRRVIADFEKLYESLPPSSPPTRTRIISPPNLPATSNAERRSQPRHGCSPSNTTSPTSCPAWRKMNLRPPVLGVSWDGTGYGLDGTVWGGEFFLVTDTGGDGFAHLRVLPIARRRPGRQRTAPHRPGPAL